MYEITTPSHHPHTNVDDDNFWISLKYKLGAYLFVPLTPTKGSALNPAEGFAPGIPYWLKLCQLAIGWTP